MNTDDQTPDEPRAPTEAERTPETTPNDAGEGEPSPEPQEAGEAERPQGPTSAAKGTGPGEGDRIAKVLSRAGVASRRDAERLILEGRVTVNGKIVESPAVNVTDRDRIAVDGDTVGAPEATRLWLYHKPAGLVTTEADEEGRPTVFENLPEDMPRVMSVGRLDMTSEGLLLLTNDGEVKRRLELPSTGWSRRYRVRINGRPTEEQFEPLRQGITVDGEDFQPMEVGIDRQQGANAWLTISLREGKNREIRRAMEHLGFTVNRLIRVSYGPFQLGDLPVGDVEEVRPKILRDQLGMGRAKPEPVTRARKARKTDDDMPVFDDEPEDRPERERLATSRPEGATVKREIRSRAPKAHDEAAPRGRAPRTGTGTTKELFAKPRTFMRVDEDRARAAAKAEAEARGENERPARGLRRDDEDRPRRPREDGDRPRSAGFRSHGGPRREGGEDRPRSAGFRSHRDEGGDRPYKPRAEGGDRPARPYKPREGGDRPARAPREGDGDRKPRWSRDDRSDRPARDGDRPTRPYKPREGDGDRPARAYKPRAEGDRPARPYKPREEGDRPARPYKPRTEGDRPARAYKPREEGDRPARPYKPRTEGDRPARAYKPREEGDRGPRRGFEPSRAPRDGDDRPARAFKPREGDTGRPYKPRAGGDRPARAYKPRDGDAPRGPGGPRGDRPPRSAGPGGPRKGPPRSGAPSGPRGPKPRRG